MNEHAVEELEEAAATPTTKMRTLLICHDGAAIDQEGLARWLASFSNLVGVVVLRESRQRLTRRIRRELKRVGALRFADVLAFRVYSKIFLARRDRRWQEQQLERMRRAYAKPSDAPVLITHSPNSTEAERFIKECAPDIVLARCKTILKENIFSIPSTGTFVMHPGVCPEYRNAHGCFWALANDDAGRVGMTLLRVDRGVDTGPVYGYYSYDFDELKESPAVIQHRVVTDNLDALEKKLAEIHAGRATTLDTDGRASATWGQPWLSSYLKWKFRARRRNR
jgi:folate-dependent phosphoribosylglycinamide formyltransferase PurN